MNRLLTSLAALVFLLPAPARADIIHLRHGGTIEGEILRDDGSVLEVKLRFGRITLRRDEVVSIVEKVTPWQEYRQRADRIAAGNREAHVSLARWAEGEELIPESAEQWIAAWRIDPARSDAETALARLDWHLVEDEWLAPDVYYSGLGWKQYHGQWTHPREIDLKEAEKDLIAREGAWKRAERRVEERRERADRAGQEVEEKRIVAEEAAGRTALFERERAQAHEEAVEAARRYDFARGEAERAYLVLELERARAERNEPNALPAATHFYHEAQRRLSHARRVLRIAEDAVGSADRKVAQARGLEIAAARSWRAEAEALRRAVEDVREAEDHRNRMQGEFDLQARAVERARQAYEEALRNTATR